MAPGDSAYQAPTPWPCSVRRPVRSSGSTGGPRPAGSEGPAVPRRRGSSHCTLLTSTATAPTRRCRSGPRAPLRSFASPGAVSAADRRVGPGLHGSPGSLSCCCHTPWAGHGALAAPPLTEPGRWPAWLDGRDPVMAAFGLLRVVALASRWYLAGVTLLGAVLRLAGAGSLVRLTDRSPSPGPPHAGRGRQPRIGGLGRPCRRRARPCGSRPPPPDGPDVDHLDDLVPPATVTMHRLGPAEPPPAPVPDASGGRHRRPTPDRWTVKPGECFWSIAEDVLADQAGAAADRRRDRPLLAAPDRGQPPELAHRDNPDLIFPAQSLRRPAAVGLVPWHSLGSSAHRGRPGDDARRRTPLRAPRRRPACDAGTEHRPPAVRDITAGPPPWSPAAGAKVS